MTMSVSNILPRDATLHRRSRLPVPVEAGWKDVWLTVTPIWAILSCTRISFYANAIGALVIVVLSFFSFAALTKERKLRAATEALVDQERLRTLRAQLNPHFLFNSLNSIVSLSAENPTTQLLVTQLSDLLRRTLQASECEEHELFEELTYLEEYLEIEQTRQPSRIDWHIRVEPGCARAAVPSLILIPLVENSVTHGLRGGIRAVSIEILAWRTRDQLIICVSNTCSHALPARDVTRPGLGLRNVRARLDVLFGPSASLSADRADPGRYEAQISLPIRDLPPIHYREQPPCAS